MRKLSRIFLFSVIYVVLTCVSSCAPVKDIAYFQDKAINSPEKVDKHGGIIIQAKDMLSIVVSSRNPELAAMFNLSSGAATSSEGGAKSGYVVDNIGCIDFPVLGTMQVAGLTRWELSDMIKDKLSKGGLLTDAVVNVQFMNFKFSVLGEVNSPGTYTIDSDGLTLLQSIAYAGDLTLYGKRGNVSVIREQNGSRVIYEVDMCSVDMFKSPAYYIQQNDIIYVEPSENRAKMSTIDDKSLRMTSIIISSSSLLVSLATMITSLIRATK